MTVRHLQNAVILQKRLGVDKESLLERGNGVNSSGPPKLRENDLRQRHCGKTEDCPFSRDVVERLVTVLLGFNSFSLDNSMRT